MNKTFMYVVSALLGGLTTGMTTYFIGFPGVILGCVLSILIGYRLSK